MIQTEWLSKDAVLAVRPDGPIDEDDFAGVARVVDPVVDQKGRLEGLLVDTRGFHGWDDAHALVAHLKFVAAHLPKVARIAVVGDQWWLRAAPLMEPFHGTPIRIFPTTEAEAAQAWLLERAPQAPTVTILPESQGASIGIRVTGRLRDADYQTMQSELERRLPKDGKLRLLAMIDDGFRGWTPKACLDDIAMAFSPWRNRFEKMALVAGPGLVRWCAEHFPRALLPYPFQVFSPDEVDKAWEWLRA